MLCIRIFFILKPSEIGLIFLEFHWDFFYIMSVYISLTTRKMSSFGCILLELKFIKNQGLSLVEIFFFNVTVGNASQDQRIFWNFSMYFQNLHVITFYLICHSICFNETFFSVQLVQVH